MRTLPRLTPILAVLFALIAVSAGIAQTQQTPAATPQPLPTATAEFLATLSGVQSAAPQTEILPPSLRFLSTTTCTSNADCPPDQLCCYPCGIPDCNFVCMTPWRKRCPPIA